MWIYLYVNKHELDGYAPIVYKSLVKKMKFRVHSSNEATASFIEEITHSLCSGKTMWPKELGSHFFFKMTVGKYAVSA